ncbi:MAG: hypothetical protein KAV00_07350 [Phycisphaerae bacterium]|nr:hypothetical protein [Phycisphaerae bacterium]
MRSISRDGRYLFGASAMDKLVFAIDLENGETAWHFRNKAIAVGVSNVLFAPDGKMVVIISPSQVQDTRSPFKWKKCIAYSSAGRILWGYPITQANAWLTVHKSAGVGNKTVFCVRKIARHPQRGDSKPHYIGLSATGERLWEYEKVVLAISPDGSRQIVGDRAYHRSSIVHFDEPATNVPSAIGPIGVAYTHDGTRLLKLPNLRTDGIIRRGTDGRFRLYSRANTQLLITNAATGKIICQINLVKP